jgi:hypothetical protein
MARWRERRRERTSAPPSAADAAPRAASSSVPPIRYPPANTPALWRTELRATTALREWAVARPRVPGPERVPRCPPPAGTCAQTLRTSDSPTASGAGQIPALP